MLDKIAKLFKRPEPPSPVKVFFYGATIHKPECNYLSTNSYLTGDWPSVEEARKIPGATPCGHCAP